MHGMFPGERYTGIACYEYFQKLRNKVFFKKRTKKNESSFLKNQKRKQQVVSYSCFEKLLACSNFFHLKILICHSAPVFTSPTCGFSGVARCNITNVYRFSGAVLELCRSIRVVKCLLSVCILNKLTKQIYATHPVLGWPHLCCAPFESQKKIYLLVQCVFLFFYFFLKMYPKHVGETC